MTKVQNPKYYNLENRTLEFGKRIIRLAKALPKNIINFKLIDQIIRSGTSMGANYREANETETKKDFQFRIRICRKESKETIYWLNLTRVSHLTKSAYQILKQYVILNLVQDTHRFRIKSGMTSAKLVILILDSV